MRRPFVFLWGIAVALLLVTAVERAWPQSPETTNRMAVLQQRVSDLVDYREWADTQMAAMKVTVADLQRRLSACNASPVERPR